MRGEGRRQRTHSSDDVIQLSAIGGESCACIQGFSHGNRARNAANEDLKMIDREMMDRMYNGLI